MDRFSVAHEDEITVVELPPLCDGVYGTPECALIVWQLQGV